MNILVTGGTKGIGRAIVDSLDGNIHVAARNEELLKGFDNYCVCDLSTETGMIKLGDYIENNKIDVLINNAGVYQYSPLDKSLKPSDIAYSLKLNLEAPIYLASRAIPNMKAQKFGRIINIGSISGVMGEAYASIYSATKAGLIGMSKALALELAEYNITVNVINPGWVETELGNQSVDDSEFSKEELIDCIPQKRFIEPVEIANLIKYLISKEAKGLTGQSINLCAGLSVGY